MRGGGAWPRCRGQSGRIAARCARGSIIRGTYRIFAKDGTAFPEDARFAK